MPTDPATLQQRLTDAGAADYKKVLKAEGLAPLDSLFDNDHGHDAVRFHSLSALASCSPSNDGGEEIWVEELAADLHGSAKYAASPDLKLWDDFSAAIHRLPSGWPTKSIDLLLAYAECGFLEQARAQVDLTRQQARDVLAKFNAHAGFQLRHGVLYKAPANDVPKVKAKARKRWDTAPNREINEFALKHGRFPEEGDE